MIELNDLYCNTGIQQAQVYTGLFIIAKKSKIQEHSKQLLWMTAPLDGTQEMIREEFPEVILLETTGDLYWTATTNLGIKYALEHGADYVMTLNNDTSAPPDFMGKMDYWSREYPQALFGAFALDADSKKPVYAGELVDWKSTRSKSWIHILREDEFKGIHKVSHFPGRGLLIPKSCFEDIGLFEERIFPHYAADYDFTHKAIRHGYEIYCNHDAKLLFIQMPAATEKIERKNQFGIILTICSGERVVEILGILPSISLGIALLLIYQPIGQLE
jgi:hypothetical protein